jgi:hypothetical protein
MAHILFFATIGLLSVSGFLLAGTVEGRRLVQHRRKLFIGSGLTIFCMAWAAFLFEAILRDGVDVQLSRSAFEVVFTSWLFIAATGLWLMLLPVLARLMGRITKT